MIRLTRPIEPPTTKNATPMRNKGVLKSVEDISVKIERIYVTTVLRVSSVVAKRIELIKTPPRKIYISNQRRLNIPLKH